MATLTVTSRGQVTLRKEALQHLGIRPGDKIELALMPGGKGVISRQACGHDRHVRWLVGRQDGQGGDTGRDA